MGLGLLQPLQGRRSAFGACDDFEFGLRIEECRETITQQAIVFDDEDLDFFLVIVADGPRSRARRRG